MKRTYRILLYEGPEDFFDHGNNWAQREPKPVRGGRVTELAHLDESYEEADFLGGVILGYAKASFHCRKHYNGVILSNIEYLLANGRKIEAIKTYKRAYDTKLKEAKEAIDFMLQK